MGDSRQINSTRSQFISPSIPVLPGQRTTSLPGWESSLGNSATRPSFAPTAISCHLPGNKAQCWEGAGGKDIWAMQARHSQCEPPREVSASPRSISAPAQCAPSHRHSPWGEEHKQLTQTLTFLGCVPVKGQPGEVEHS